MIKVKVMCVITEGLLGGKQKCYVSIAKNNIKCSFCSDFFRLNPGVQKYSTARECPQFFLIADAPKNFLFL